MAYSAGTAYLEIVPSFLNLESLVAKGARDIAQSLDKSLGASLGKSMKNAVKTAERDTEQAAQQLGKTFADNALKKINAALANIPAGDRILSGLRKELVALSQVDVGKGFDEKDFITRVEKAYDALRKAQQDAQGKNAVGRFTNAGNAAQELGAVKDIVEAARKRGFAAGDAFSDAYQGRLKAMDRALPDLKIDKNSSQEERAVAAFKARVQDAMKLSLGDVATKDNNPLNLNIGAKINAEDLKRVMGELEGLADQFTERFNSHELVLPLDKARQQAGGFFDDIKTQEDRANEQVAAQYLKDWDAALAERSKREQKAREQARADEQKMLDDQERYHEKYLADLARLEEQNRAQRGRAQRKEIEDRARELQKAREQEYRDQQRAEQEALRSAEKAAAELERQRQKAAAEAEAAAQRAYGQTTAGEASQKASSAADRIVDLPVHLQANDIDREMAAIRARLKAMGDLKIGVDIDSETFASNVQREFSRLSAIAKDKKVDIEVRTDAARAATELGGILVLLNRIDHDKATVNVDTNGAATAMENLAGLFSLNLGRLGGLIALGASLGTALVPAAAAAASAIGSIGTAALGAGAGISVMALAFSGIGDAIKALGAYKDSLQNSNVALKRSANQVEAAQQQVRSAEMALANTRRTNAEAAIKAQRAIRDALRDQKNDVRDVARANQDAVQKVADAEKDVRDAKIADLDTQTKLNQAYIEARRSLEDLNSQLRGNALDQRQATLDIAKAKDELDKMLSNPRATQAEREQADITYQQRLLQMDDLKRKGAQLSDEQDKRFREGISQSDEVKKARKDLNDADEKALKAQQALTRAQQDKIRTQQDGVVKLQKAEEKVAESRQAAADQQKNAAYSEYQGVQSLISARRALENATNRDSVAGGSQLSNLQVAMAKLSPTARAFAKYIFGMQDAFFALRRAADPVLAGIQTAMESFLGKTSKDAEKNLQPVFAFVHQVADALGQTFINFAKLLKTPTFTKFFDYIAKTAVPTIDLLYQMFENVLVGVVNLFLAFTPLTSEVNNGLLDMTKSFRRWSEGLSKNKGFQDFVGYMRKSGPAVAHLLGQIAKAVGDLIIAAAPIGLVVVNMFTKLFEAINKIPAKVLTSIVAGIATAAGAIGLFALAAAAATLELPGLIALILGGLVIAFSALAGVSGDTGKIFSALWSGLKTGAQATFDFVKKAIEVLKPVFSDMADAAIAFWQKGLMPVFDDIYAFGQSLFEGLKPSFGNVVSLLKQLGGFFFYLYDQVILPVYKGILTVWQALWVALKPVFDVIGAAIGALATIIFWLLDKVIMPVVFFIVKLLVKILTPVIQFLWKFIVHPILILIGAAFQVAAAIIKVAIGLILIVLKALGWMFKSVYEDWIKPVWDLLVKNVFKPMGEWIGKHIEPMWKKALGALAKHWDTFKNALGFVIRIILHYGLNEGLLKGYNWLADKFNITPRDVKIPEPSGDWYTKSKAPSSTGFATGGAVYGPGSATSDSIVARLSNGEHVLTAEEVRAAGGHGAIYALREMLRNGFRLPGFASGGAVSNDGSSSKMGIGGWLSGVAKSIGHGASKVFGSIKDFLKDPAGNLRKIFEGIVAKVPKSGMAHDLLSIPAHVLDSILDKVKGIIGIGGNATGALGSMTGKAGWPWQESVLRAAFGDKVVFTSTTGGGHAKNSWHYRGRAVDSIGSGIDMMTIFNWIKSHYGATSKELIYSPAGVGIKDGKPVNIRDYYGNSVYQNHFSHVHWAYDNGGLLPDTRNMPGGVMTVFHGSRTPDKVLTDSQWRNMATLANQAQMAMASGDTLNFNFRDSTLDESKLAAIQARRDALARVNRPNY